MRSPSPASRGGWLSAFFVALLAYALLAWRFDFVCDDAYISFRYSRHFAEGHGLVYNLGRVPPVEGYSNFLWVVWLALFERLGLDVTVAARLSSAACGAALLFAFTRFVRTRLELDSTGTLFAAVFLATLPPMAMWATGGLAAMPLALFVFLTYERLLGDPARPRGVQAGAWAVLASLVRADGAVWVVMLLAAAGLAWMRGPKEARLGKAVLVTGALLVFALAAHVAWRVSYYGDYLPNTARVKAGFSLARIQRGLDYVFAWLLLLPSAVVVLALSLRRWEPARWFVGLPCLLVVPGTLAYAVWVGGDFMPFGRFLLPAVPFLGLLFAAHWSRFGRAPAALAGCACILSSVLAAFDKNLVPGSVRERFHFRADRTYQSEIERWDEMKRNAERWVLLGKALNEHTLPGESIILGGIGAAGYYSEVFIYDEYGLVTPEVVARGKVRKEASPGHDLRVNKDFFFDLRPTYLSAILTADGAGQPPDELPWWADSFPGGWEHHPWRALVTNERYALSAEAGYPEGAVLNLLRFHW